MQRVVITGLGAVTPIGLTADDFWYHLTQGVSGVGPVTQFDASDLPTRIGAEVTGFDPRAYMDTRTAQRSHRATQFALAATLQALEDAGLDPGIIRGPSTGVVINTCFGGISAAEGETARLLTRGARRVSPFFVPAMMPNAVACQVAITTGAEGPVLTSTLACASGNYALLEAMYILQRGEAEVMIAGGTDACMTRLVFSALCNMGALSRRNDAPAQASRPFDRDRDGFVCGEGAAVMILETEAHARARRARVYAEVAGGALTSDAHHITAPHPNGEGAQRAMAQALRVSGVAPADVDVIYAHGTSTPLNDVTETEAIKAVFADHAYRVAISATKSMVGHLLGAAGAISALAAVLSIRDGIVPPTVNLENPDPRCDLDYVPHVARHQPVRVALVNAFGFGGQNVALVLRRYPEQDG